MGQILCQSFPKNSAPPNTFVLDFWPLDLQENTFLLFTATKFEVTCNSSHRRLILTNSQNTLLHFSIQCGCIFLLRLIFNIIASLCVSLSQRTSSQVSAFPGVSMCIYTHEVHLSICYLLFYSLLILLPYHILGSSRVETTSDSLLAPRTNHTRTSVQEMPVELT